MYESVYELFLKGGCLGIFPEGGSHDRTDLLPLKPGKRPTLLSFEWRRRYLFFLFVCAGVGGLG